MTDNKGLKYLLDQLNLNSRQSRWIAFLSEYDFKIQHIKGKENKVVDALSRNARMNFTTLITLIQQIWMNSLKQGQNKMKFTKTYKLKRKKIQQKA